MTEEQAKNKWCPMVNIAGYQGASITPNGHPDTKCVASQCMMWRLTTLVDGIRVFKGDGYCGLGGKP